MAIVFDIQDVKARIKEAFGGLGIDGVEVMKNSTPVASGHLKDNIAYNITEEGDNVVLTYSFPFYALYVEFGCFFDKNTNIVTKQGIKRICDLKLHDLIYTGKGYKKLIQKEKLEIGYPINKIKVWTDNNYLELTEDHPIKTKKGWKLAKDLKVSDEVTMYDKE